MAEKNYNDIIDRFFKEFDDAMAAEIKKRNIWTIVVLVSLVLAIVCGIFGSDSEILSVLFIIFSISTIVGLIVRKKKKTKVKTALEVQEDRFFDEVYMKVMAGELDAEAESKSFRDTTFEKSSACPGYLLQSRDIKLGGMYNGRPYKISQVQSKLIDNVLYNKNTNTVLKYTTLDITDGMTCEQRLKHPVDNQITICSLLSGYDTLAGKSVKMDNKNFKFKVNCDDPVTAYKFLTADVMEGITELDKRTKIKSIQLYDGNMEILTDDRIINLYYSASLSEKSSRNRKKYTSERMVKDVADSVNNIKKFLEGTLVTSIV